MKLGCIVMASGLSQRFGANKLTAPFRGRPLLSWTLDALPRTELDRILVVTRSPEVDALCRPAGFPCLLHDKPHLSDTIRLGVSAMEGMDGCLFTVGDQPLCQRESLLRLLSGFRSAPDRPARLAWQGRPGNPVLFPASFFPALAALEGERGGTCLLPPETMLVPACHPWELEDADTPEALARLESLVP